MEEPVNEMLGGLVDKTLEDLIDDTEDKTEGDCSADLEDVPKLAEPILLALGKDPNELPFAERTLLANESRDEPIEPVFETDRAAADDELLAEERGRLNIDPQTEEGMAYPEGYPDENVKVEDLVIVVVERGWSRFAIIDERTVVLNSLSRVELNVSGQTVVDTAVVAVTTATGALLWRTGQLVSHGGQPRTVTSWVWYAVEVEIAGMTSTTMMDVREVTD
jgi:hypothetical protein